MAEGTTINNDTENSLPINIDEIQWVCNKCKCISKNEEVPMLECDLCERHLCIKCAKVSLTHYRALAKVDTMWFCSAKCVHTAKTKLNDKTQARLSTSEVDIQQITIELEDRIVENMTRYNKKIHEDLQNELGDRMRVLEQKITSQLDESKQIVKDFQENSQKTWADIVKHKEIQTQQNPNQDISNGESFTKIMQEALEISKKEQEQKEEREKSIIVFRYRESNIRNREERIEEELNFANELCDKGIKVGNVEIIKTRRLGKYDSEATRPRPLKITFESREQQQKVIANIANLKEAEDKYKSISINIDMTKEERELVRLKVNEAKRMNQESTDTKYLVKGPPSNLRIIEIKKK